MKNITFSGKNIVIDGVETQIRSGAMHYFRIRPELWKDRLLKLKQCGLNTVETYLAWNLHEPRQGEFDFSGPLDFVKYSNLAGEIGLMVMVRPGPFICSEWEFGGLPFWLLNENGLRLRCSNELYLKKIKNYFSKILTELAELQCTNGGPVIMMQLENEYGCIGGDREYLKWMYDFFRKMGINIPLFTSDCIPNPLTLHCGTIEETLATGNGRNHPEKYLDFIQSQRPDVPEIFMELWNGAGHFRDDDWKSHDPEDVQRDIELLMKRNASFNLYMFHGGTSFGFMNGAVYINDEYRPHLTSYDTDAPLDEAGNPTPKYFAIQKTIKKYAPEAFTATPAVTKAKALGNFKFTQRVSLMNSLDKLANPINSVTAEYMESFGQDYGWILYRFDATSLPAGCYSLTLDNLRDRAQVFRDGLPVGTIYRNRPSGSSIQITPGVIDILVENMGRVNAMSGWNVDWNKGVTGIRIDSKQMFHFQIYCLSMKSLKALEFVPFEERTDGPAFYRAEIEIDSPADTHLRIPYGTKGQVWINGFNLGRFWNIGPQYSLYIPSVLLKKGKNEVIVFEEHAIRENVLEFIDHFDRGGSVSVPL